MTDIRVIVPYYDRPDLLLECARSIAAQDLRPFAVGLHQDGIDPERPDLTDGAAAAAKLLRAAGVGLSYSYSGNRAGELHSVQMATYHQAQRWSTRAGPDAVFVHLCADDYLPAPDVLSRLAEVYEDPDVWMTYGGYAFEDGNPGHCQPYPPEAHDAGDYRDRPWQASHLRSYRYGLWRRIPPEQFIDPATGATWFYATDRAMMLPMLEMAREHARFMPCDPPLYTYRRHPGNVPSFMDAGHCERVAAMPRLERVETIYA